MYGKMSSNLSFGTVTKYIVQSRLVIAFSSPPSDSTRLWKLPTGCVCVPLNQMCSKMCDIPSLSAGSFREPTLTQNCIVTSGLCSSSLTVTVSPFGSCVEYTSCVAVVTGMSISFSGS